MSRSPKKISQIITHMLSVGLMEAPDKIKLTDISSIVRFLKIKMDDTEEESRKGLDMLEKFPVLRILFTPAEIVAYEYFARKNYTTRRFYSRFSSNP
jgi:hypothetical protein